MKNLLLTTMILTLAGCPEQEALVEEDQATTKEEETSEDDKVAQKAKKKTKKTVRATKARNSAEGLFESENEEELTKTAVAVKDCENKESKMNKVLQIAGIAAFLTGCPGEPESNKPNASAPAPAARSATTASTEAIVAEEEVVEETKEEVVAEEEKAPAPKYGVLGSDKASLTYSAFKDATTTLDFQLTNSGEAKAHGVAFGGIAAPFAVSNNGCTTVIQAGVTCTITLAYIPTTAGTHTDKLDISYNDGSKVKYLEVALSGTATDKASLSLSATTYDFGTEKVDNTKSTTITLTNNGGVAATNLAFNGLNDPFSKTAGTCADTLAAGSSCTVDLQFAPTTIGANWSDTYNITYNDGAADQALALNLDGASVDRIIQVAQGFKGTCVLYKEGNVKCAGMHYYIPGITEDQHTFIDVPGITNATQITVNSLDVCALLADKTVSCWGQAFGSVTDQGVSEVDQVDLHGWDVLVKQTDGNMKQTRIKNYLLNVSSDFPGTYQSTHISRGSGHSCTVVTNGDVYCWGLNDRKQIGDDNINATFDDPTKVSGLSNITSTTSGQGFSCALDTSKDVYCWGSDSLGQLADGSGTSTPTQLSADPSKIGVSNITAVAAGFHHACALKTDKTVSCWGYAKLGQLGDNDDDGLYKAFVVDAIGLTNVVQIGLGRDTTAALDANGDVWVWGWNSNGQLGLGDTTNRLVPTKVPGL